MRKQYFVYIMTNKSNTVLYTGFTSNLLERCNKHKIGFYESGFTKKYNIHKLVYYEIFDHPECAINREKQIKAGSRKNKLDLINNFNKNWEDLYQTLNPF